MGETKGTFGLFGTADRCYIRICLNARPIQSSYLYNGWFYAREPTADDVTGWATSDGYPNYVTNYFQTESAVPNAVTDAGCFWMEPGVMPGLWKPIRRRGIYTSVPAVT